MGSPGELHGVLILPQQMVMAILMIQEQWTIEPKTEIGEFGTIYTS